MKGELKGEDANQPLFSYLLLEDDFGNEVSFLLSTSWTLDTQKSAVVRLIRFLYALDF